MKEFIIFQLERGYRDCRQETRQGYAGYCMMHQALDDSDQTRMYGISESIIQALHSLQQSHNKGLYYGFRDAMLSCLVTMHQAPGTS